MTHEPRFQLLEGNGVQAYCAWQERREERRMEGRRQWMSQPLTVGTWDPISVRRAAAVPDEFREKMMSVPFTGARTKPTPLFELSI